MSTTQQSVDYDRIYSTAIFHYSKFIVNSFYPKLYEVQYDGSVSKIHKSILMFHAAIEDNVLLTDWLKDCPDVEVEVTKYPTIDLLKANNNAIVEAIVRGNAITENPLSKHVTLIFVLQVGTGWTFAVSKDVPCKRISKAFPPQRIWHSGKTQ